MPYGLWVLLIVNGRPKLLFLSQTLPYPPDGGVKIRTYNILRILARTFDISALCFYRRERGLRQRDIDHRTAALGELAQIEAFPIPQEHYLGRLLWDHLRSVLTSRTYTVYGYESSRYRRRLKALLGKVPFDLVHADSLDMSGYFPLLSGHPLVCVHHDVQSVLLRRRASAERSRKRRLYLAYQAGLMEREEQHWCPRVTLNVTVSEVDRDALLQTARGGTFAVVPNGVDTEFFRPAPSDGEGIVFVGGTTWFPNRDALSFFCEEILPLVRKNKGERLVRWVGRATEGERRYHHDRFGIDLTGYVEDVRPYVWNAACYVVPIRIGGGTRVKILDAWAMGKAVVSTSIGCEGLDAVDGENILIRDDPGEFADAVLEVLSNRDLRGRLELGARRTAEQLYSWEVIGEKVISKYLSLMGTGDDSTDALASPIRPRS